MTKPRVVLIEDGFADHAEEERAATSNGYEWLSLDPGWDPSQGSEAEIDALLEKSQGGEIRVLRRIVVGPERMREHFQGCSAIIRTGVGTDNLDAQTATEMGIVLVNIPGYCKISVRDHALAMIFSLLRDLRQSDVEVRTGRWSEARPDTLYEMSDLTFGIVGLGTIGQSLAEALKLLYQGTGCRILACDPFVPSETAEPLGVQLLEKEQLLRESDVISLHLPLLPETAGYIDREAVELMDGAFLVNTARGPLVDLAALESGLESGKVLGAGLDVYPEEPPHSLPQLHMDSVLRNHPRVILSGHKAYASRQSQPALQRGVAEAIGQLCRGTLPSVTNLDVLETSGRYDDYRGTYEKDPQIGWFIRRHEQFRAGK